MFDDKLNIIQWYFDVSKFVECNNCIPYQDDLYLDLVIKPTWEFKILEVSIDIQTRKSVQHGIITNQRNQVCLMSRQYKSYDKDFKKTVVSLYENGKGVSEISRE